MVFGEGVCWGVEKFCVCGLLVFMVIGGLVDVLVGFGCVVVVEVGCDDVVIGCEGVSGRVGCLRFLVVVGVIGFVGLLCVEEFWLFFLVCFFLRRLLIVLFRGIKDVL